jgi:hypothetical protein
MVTYVAMLMWRLIVKLNYASPDWDSSPMLVVGQSGRQHYTDLEKYDGSVITDIGVAWVLWSGEQQTPTLVQSLQNSHPIPS